MSQTQIRLMPSQAMYTYANGYLTDTEINQLFLVDVDGYWTVDLRTDFVDVELPKLVEMMGAVVIAESTLRGTRLLKDFFAGLGADLPLAKATVNLLRRAGKIIGEHIFADDAAYLTHMQMVYNRMQCEVIRNLYLSAITTQPASAEIEIMGSA